MCKSAFDKVYFTNLPIQYSQKTFERDVEELCRTILMDHWDAKGDYWRPEVIIYIPRGGAVIATYMAHLLDVKYIIPYYPEGHELHDQQVIHLSSISAGKDVLVVDDISDSGRTLSNAMIKLYAAGLTKDPEGSTLRTCTLWIRKGTANKPDYFARTVVGTGWIEFPWERTWSSGKATILSWLSKLGIHFNTYTV